MWIEKAAKNTFGNIFYLFEEFLDINTFNDINIIGTKKINDTDVYVVKARQYVKNIEKTFYFGDFSVMTDLMDNSSYVRKSSSVINDMSWGIILYSKLNNNEVGEYKKQFVQYQKNKLKNDSELLKSF